MRWLMIVAALLGTAPALAQDKAAPVSCTSCAAWNAAQEPFRVFGNTYYVGTHGLGSILIVTDHGLVLIDGALADSAPQIAAHIRALGFDPRNIKLILNTHAHFDHAGGLAWLQKLSGAPVALSPWSAQVLRPGGGPAPDDPQYDTKPLPIARVARIETIHDGQVLRVENEALTAHFTPGHTPGGTSWSWVSCEQSRCLNIVYADSLTAVSADNYTFMAHPDLVRGFHKSFDTLDALPCDILLTPHPEFSGTLDKLHARVGGNPDAFIDPQSCRKYAAASRDALAKRLAQETKNGR